VLTVV
jgi:hypothetical protein